MKNDFFLSSPSNHQTSIGDHKKIKQLTFITKNELAVCKKIQQIKYYFLKYEIIVSYSSIQVGKMNNYVIDQLDTVYNTNNQYLLLEYNQPYNPIQQPLIDFEDFLFTIKTPKPFIYHIIDSYDNIIHNLIALEDNSVCLFDLSSDSIIFTIHTYRPILKNFENSIVIDKLNDSKVNQSYIVNIIRNIKNFTYKPLEIHLLFYIVMNNEITLSYSLMEIICDNFIKNLTVLEHFSPEYTNSFRNECILFLKSFINKDKTFIIDEIIQYYKSWDNYSISILYIHLFSTITHVFSLQETFINKMTTILLNNIHPNPSKRETLKTTIEAYEILWSENTDWSFVNDIPMDKMMNLHEAL
jgi:hypothetical protein